MYKIFIVFLLTTLLFAQNPSPFSALGDLIYDNVDKIENLKNIKEYSVYEKEIDSYVADVKKVKKAGFALEKKRADADAKAYLKRLRELAKRYDFFLHTIQVSYENAKREQNSRLFSEIINSGLFDTKEHKKEIIDYYFEHQEDMNATGLIQSYLDEDAKLRAKKEAQQRRIKSKRQKELERIRYIREHDRIEKERLEKRLEEELNKKKREIREYQKKELSKTI
jgi:hypothetical protein